MMQPPYEIYLALRYLRFHRGRTFLSLITMISVAGVCVGTAALVIALALNAGFVDDVRSRIYSGSAHLTLMSSHEVLFRGADDLVRQAETFPGVAVAGPVLYSPAMLTRDDHPSTGFTEIHGIDPVAHAKVVHGEAFQESPFMRLDQAAEDGRDGIILGADLALSIGVIEGDDVRAVVPMVTLSPWGAQPRSRVFHVVGTFRSDHFQQDSKRAYVHRDAANRLLRAESGTSWVEVRLDDLEQLEAMKATLKAGLGDSWLVIDLIEQNQDLLKALATEKLLLFLAIGLIVIVAALNIVSTLILMVTDKVKEIGTLSAMGAKPRSIAAVFMIQGGLIGAVGTMVGLLLGSVLAYGIDRLELIKLDPDVYYLNHVPFTLQPTDLIVVGLSVFAISLVATVYPAMQAARLRPVDAIRYE